MTQKHKKMSSVFYSAQHMIIGIAVVEGFLAFPITAQFSSSQDIFIFFGFYDPEEISNSYIFHFYSSSVAISDAQCKWCKEEEKS